MIKNITVEEIERQFFKYHLSQAGLDEMETITLNSFLDKIEDWKNKPLKSNDDLFSFDHIEENNNNNLLLFSSTLDELKAKGMIELEDFDSGLRINISPYILKIYAIAEKLHEEWKLFFESHASNFNSENKSEAIKTSVIRHLEENYFHLMKLKSLVNDFDFSQSDSIDAAWSA